MGKLPVMNANEVLMTLDLAEDSNVIKGAQLFPIGEWRHPAGKIKINYRKAKNFVRGFNEKLAGQDLPVLFIHSDKRNVSNPSYGKAAGWIKKMHADRNKGVTIDIEFTDAGAESVRKGEYKYLSAEYFEQVQLPHHEAPKRDVVVGAALVNRPHLKGMDPILNEETGHLFIFEADTSKPDESSGGGGPVDPILVSLAESAGLELSEDVTELTDDERKRIESHLTELSDDSKVTELEATNTLLQKKLDESEDPDRKTQKSLAEAGFEEEARLLSEYRGERTLKSLSAFVPNGHEFTPAVDEAIKMYGETGDEEKLLEAAQILASGKGVVDLTEHGSGGTNKSKNLDEEAGDQIIALAEEIAKDQEIDFNEALGVAADENPELWAAHQKAVGGKEVTA